MSEVKNIIRAKKEIIILTSPEMEYKTFITDVEEKIFWISLPRYDGQILMLQQNLNLKIRVPVEDGSYNAETKVLKIVSDYNRFYGLSIPGRFEKSDERKHLRGMYRANVKFMSKNIVVQTTMIDFSAGGVMVYLVPALSEILHKNDLAVCFEIDDIPFRIRVVPAWRKIYDNVPYVGFKFPGMLPSWEKNWRHLPPSTDGKRLGPWSMPDHL